MNPDLTPEQLDLLLSLTDGTLVGADLERAEAAVAADPRLAAEYALQREALAFLADEPVAPLADFEAARIRRSVLDRVAPQPVRSSPRWATRLMPVAATLAIIVVGIGFLSGRLGNTGGSEMTDSLSSDTTAAATAEAERAPLPAVADDQREEDGGSIAGAMQESMTTTDGLPELGAIGPDDLPGFVDDIDERLGEKRDVVSPLSELAPSCDGVEVDGKVLVEYTVAATATWYGLDVLVLEMVEPGGPIVVIDPDTCDVLHDDSPGD